jgi:hypothetical protein
MQGWLMTDQGWKQAAARLRAQGFAPWAWALALTLGVIVFAATGRRAYEAPLPGLLTPEQATARAAELLERLRPAPHPPVNFATGRFSSATATDDDGKCVWRFGVLSADGTRLYRVAFTGDGKFRNFSVYQKPSAPASAESPPPAISPEIARRRASGWFDFLEREAGVRPPDSASPTATVETLSGRNRRMLAWTLKDAPARAVGTLEFVFDGDDVQRLSFRPASVAPLSDSSREALAGLTFFAILLIGLLPTLIAFVRASLRGEIGSKTAFAVGAAVPGWAGAWLFWLAIYILFLTNMGASWHDLGERGFVAPSSPFERAFLAIFALGAIFLTVLVTTTLGGVGAAVAEASDWNHANPWLTDIFRVTRRRALPWKSVGTTYAVGLTLGVWLIAIDAAGRRFGGDGVHTIYEFADWARDLAAGRFPYAAVLFEHAAAVIVMTAWLLPLGALLRKRFAEWQIAIALSLLVCGSAALFPQARSTWPFLALAVVAVIGALVRYGWLCAIFGLTVAGALFPLLWGMLHPHGFRASFLSGVPALLIPAGLASVRRLFPRRTRAESYDLAPPYIRERFSRERVKQELDIRWSIHQSLVPQSGIALHDANIAAEYVHTPEQGRELFAFIPLDCGRWGIAIGEVSGQGLQASMLLAVTLATLKSKALRYPDDPVQVMERVNRSLAHRLAETDSQVQLVYGVADFSNREFCYCNAGYVTPVTLSASDARPARNDEPDSRLDPPIGRAGNATFTGRTLRLRPQDRLILSSDWVCDAFDLKLGAVALETKLRQLAEPFRERPPRELAQGVVAHGRALRLAHNGSPMEITIVCVRF